MIVHICRGDMKAGARGTGIIGESARRRLSVYNRRALQDGCNGLLGKVSRCPLGFLWP